MALQHHEPHVENNRSAVMHLHGGIKITQRADGYPLFDITPGESDSYDYPVSQEAATLWYHDHTIGKTRLNVYMGLAGFFIVQGGEPAGLPSGKYDVPLVFQDRRLSGDGQLAYDRLFDDMFFGDVMVVNGRAWPYFEVEARRYRLRLLNGSNTRTYTFQLGAEALPFHVIGSDGGLLPAPAEVARLTLTPGERADVVVDFAQLAPGDDINFINVFHEHEAEYHIHDLLQFRILPVTSTAGNGLPAVLRTDPLPLPQADQAIRTRQFKLEDFPDAELGSRWLINNEGFSVVDDVVNSGDVEIWEWVNKSDMIHPMHIHNVHFRVLGRWKAAEHEDGRIIPGRALPLDPAEAGAKDTVRVGPLELVRVVAQFERAGTSGELFPFHCHVLEHEDYDMMRQFRLD
jgi:spore coat protein A